MKKRILFLTIGFMILFISFAQISYAQDEGQTRNITDKSDDILMFDGEDLKEQDVSNKTFMDLIIIRITNDNFVYKWEINFKGDANSTDNLAIYILREEKFVFEEGLYPEGIQENYWLVQKAFGEDNFTLRNAIGIPVANVTIEAGGQTLKFETLTNLNPSVIISFYKTEEYAFPQEWYMDIMPNEAFEPIPEEVPYDWTMVMVYAIILSVLAIPLIYAVRYYRRIGKKESEKPKGKETRERLKGRRSKESKQKT